MLQTLHRLHPFICTGLGQCLPAGAPLQVLEEAGDASSWFTFFRLSLGRQFKLLLRDAELVQGRLIQVRAGGRKARPVAHGRSHGGGPAAPPCCSRVQPRGRHRWSTCGCWAQWWQCRAVHWWVPGGRLQTHLCDLCTAILRPWFVAQVLVLNIIIGTIFVRVSGAVRAGRGASSGCRCVLHTVQTWPGQHVRSLHTGTLPLQSHVLSPPAPEVVRGVSQHLQVHGRVVHVPGRHGQALYQLGACHLGTVCMCPALRPRSLS